MVKRRRSSYLQPGFTLIELLIVISIIGILAGLLFINFGGVRERGRDAARKNDLRQLKTALRLYYNDYQRYPFSSTGAPSYAIRACNKSAGADPDDPDPANFSVCQWGATFTDDVQYMELPQDPLNTGDYVYRYEMTNDGESFNLCALLENTSDSQAQESRESCGFTDAQQAPCGITSSVVFERLYMQCSN